LIYKFLYTYPKRADFSPLSLDISHHWYILSYFSDNKKNNGLSQKALQKSFHQFRNFRKDGGGGGNVLKILNNNIQF